MRKIKFLSAMFLTVLLMASCGTAVIARDGECRVTVTSKGKSVSLSEDNAAKLTILAEKALSDEYTGITELFLLVPDEEMKRFGREGLSVIVEYANTHKIPVSMIDHDIEKPEEANIVSYYKNVDTITVLIDDDDRYIMANGSVFLFPQEYYDELMSYLQ